MDEASKHVESDESDKPEHDENEGNGCEHVFKLLGKRNSNLVQCTA